MIERAMQGSRERLPLGVAARLSRYLQVLTQAKKMGRSTISSQELAEYTHINPTQIRRDLSGFGKFGKRGVGYNVDSLVSQIRKILRTAGQHNIALLGAGNLGTAEARQQIAEFFAAHPVEAAERTEPELAGGFGLRGMRERAELVGGNLTIESARGAGTTVRLEVPLG